MAEEEREGRSSGGIKSRWRRFRRTLKLSRQYAQEEKEERRSSGRIKSRWRRFRIKLKLSRQYATEKKEEGIPKNDIRSSWRRFRQKLQSLGQYATPKKKLLYISKEIEYFNVTLLPLMGYIILGLISIDYIVLLIQPQFFNPNWEYQTIGKIVETIWAPIIGLALIFYRREGTTIGGKELGLLFWISRFALLLGILSR